MGFSEQPKQVLASTDTRGSSLRAEQTWSWAQQKSFGKVLSLSCSEVCFQLTGSCVSRPLSAAFPPKSCSRALGSVCSQSPKTPSAALRGCRAFLQLSQGSLWLGLWQDRGQLLPLERTVPASAMRIWVSWGAPHPCSRALSAHLG